MTDQEATAAQILLAAADLIENSEWVGDPGVLQATCHAIAWTVSGAVARVAPDLGAALDAIAVLSRFLRLDGVASWEQEIGRTVAEVVAALRAAAAEASA